LYFGVFVGMAANAQLLVGAVEVEVGMGEDGSYVRHGYLSGWLQFSVFWKAR
jgi:hypothetical protein